MAINEQVDALEKELGVLQKEHEKLKQLILDLEKSGIFSDLSIQELKKRKLLIKDKIAEISALL